jgi:molecular chaperone GrpE
MKGERVMSDPTVSPEPARTGDQNPNGAAANEAAKVLEDFETLRSKAEERDQFLALLKRTQADFDNYQKRNQREREQEHRYRNESLARELLPVIDNLERAVAAAKQVNEQGPLVQGVHMVLSQFLDLLRRHGITPIEAQGQPFDPNLHQALMQQPAGESPNTVVQVLERGFKLHDRVLRPASVVVSVAKPDHSGEK